MARFSAPHRYLVQYGSLHGGGFRYVVYDNERDVVLTGHDAKSSCIAAAQRLNGFEPVDGSEETYGRQIA